MIYVFETVKYVRYDVYFQKDDEKENDFQVEVYVISIFYQSWVVVEVSQRLCIEKEAMSPRTANTNYFYQTMFC